jgi:hypothetical protein
MVNSPFRCLAAGRASLSGNDYTSRKLLPVNAACAAARQRRPLHAAWPQPHFPLIALFDLAVLSQ